MVKAMVKAGKSGRRPKDLKFTILVADMYGFYEAIAITGAKSMAAKFRRLARNEMVR